MSEGAHVKMRASKMVREHVVSDLERMNEGVHVIMCARKKAHMYESLHTPKSGVRLRKKVINACQAYVHSDLFVSFHTCAPFHAHALSRALLHSFFLRH